MRTVDTIYLDPVPAKADSIMVNITKYILFYLFVDEPPPNVTRHGPIGAILRKYRAYVYSRKSREFMHNCHMFSCVHNRVRAKYFNTGTIQHCFSFRQFAHGWAIFGE